MLLTAVHKNQWSPRRPLVDDHRKQVDEWTLIFPFNSHLSPILVTKMTSANKFIHNKHSTRLRWIWSHFKPARVLSQPHLSCNVLCFFRFPLIPYSSLSHITLLLLHCFIIFTQPEPNNHRAAVRLLVIDSTWTRVENLWQPAVRNAFFAWWRTIITCAIRGTIEPYWAWNHCIDSGVTGL